MSHGRNTFNSSRIRRVSRQQHCPVCGKSDWCGISQDGQLCICMRIEDGAIRATDNGGFLHKLDASRIPGRTWREAPEDCPPKPVDTTNWPVLAATFTSKVNPACLQRLSLELGVSADSLKRLWVGWSPRDKAWSFPMYQVNGYVCGIRLRNWQGHKWAVRGGKQGLFIPQYFPYCLDHLRLFVAEGPTDTAALLDMGFIAVGRPSCRGMEQQVVQLAQQTRAGQVVIATDNDQPGQDGAAHLASVLQQAGIRHRIMAPPAGVKDIRAWMQAGATADDITSLLDTDRGGVL